MCRCFNYVEVRGGCLCEGESQMDVINNSREGYLGFLANVLLWSILQLKRVKWLCCDLQSKEVSIQPCWGASVLVYLQVAAPVIILLGPCRNAAKRVIVLQDKQAGTPWHPPMHKAGWAARRDCKPAGLSFRCERSGIAQGAVPQDFQGLMLSQGKWSTAFLLDKWIAASLCKLIIWPLFAIRRNLWCWSSESAIK